MKKIPALILICALIISLAACASKNPSAQNNPTDNTSDESTPVDDAPDDNTPYEDPYADVGGELFIWISPEALAEALIEGFNSHYPNVIVRYESIFYGEIDSRLALDGPNGIGPDLIAVAHSSVGNLVADGLIEPFTAGLQAKVEDVMLESAVYAVTVEGEVYGTPYSMEPIILFYNKDLIDTPPSTMEEIIEAAKTYNDPSADKYYMRWMLDSYHNNIFPAAFGFKLFGESGTDWKNPGFDSPAMAKGLEFYASMRPVFDVDFTDADTDYTMNAFTRGETPLHLGGPWAISFCRDAGINFGTAKIPTINGNQPLSITGIQIAAVSSYSDNMDAAFAFAGYMASEEAANILYKIYGSVPALKDHSVVEGLLEDEQLIGLVEQSRYAYLVPTIPELLYTWMPWGTMFLSAWDGLKSIEDIQKQAMEDYEAALNMGGLSMYD